MADLTSMQQLISAHITAVADQERKFHLQDWGLIDQASVRNATDPADDALVAICGARPTEQADVDLRRSYLADHLGEAIYAEKTLTQRVIIALIDDGDAA